MVKVILQLYPVIPAANEEEREALRPMGRDSERYHALLPGLHELVRSVDDMGFWGVSGIEHHFHSEGYEVGPSPGILNAYWAAITKQVRVGALGYVMSAQNPLRVAEETAILDHLSGGRYFVGFTRGYQARWTNVLGQHLGSKATLSPSGMTAERRAALGEAEIERLRADDRTNRDIFEEQVDLVLRAWTEESIEHKSDRWEIPYPHEDGIAWKMAATQHLGAPGEMDESGRLRRTSVVPAPYQRPHPPVFVPATGSRETVEYAGIRGFNTLYFTPIERAAEYGGAYVKAAQTADRDARYGQNQALVRWLQIGETSEEARQAVIDYDVEIFRNLYNGLTPMAYDDGDPVKSVVDSGLWATGTASQVRDHLVEQWKRLPAEYIVIVSHYAQQPLESMRRTLELFMSEVKPALDELSVHEEAPVAA
jgi:alkanesulfonate monooxygenase SsuD/methylene tetrahydromethanopterin reductase-like flavin-dependent oxidoreductase (luciferase family)